METALKTDTAKRIKKEIEAHVRGYSNFFVVYSNWYIGITNNVSKRKTQHKTANKGDLYFWVDYNARSRRIAEAIELYFHKKGMLETEKVGGAKEDSKYIYVYKKHPTIVD